MHFSDFRILFVAPQSYQDRIRELHTQRCCVSHMLTFTANKQIEQCNMASVPTEISANSSGRPRERPTQSHRFLPCLWEGTNWLTVWINSLAGLRVTRELIYTSSRKTSSATCSIWIWLWPFLIYTYIRYLSHSHPPPSHFIKVLKRM